MKREASKSKEAVSRSFWRTVRMVLWSFFGVRKSSEWQEDSAQANPFHIIVVGLIGVVLLIVGLMVLVNWVVGH
jgi:hypothetical protein